MTTKEKLLKFIKFKEISKKKFYDITGFSNGFLDSGKYIGTDKLKVVLELFPDLNFKWLILDEGEMIVNSNNQIFIQNGVEDDKYIIESLEYRINALTDLIDEKERLIKEKERLIEILLNKNS